MTQEPTLHLAGVYHRRVKASLARIWENVFDWEHLAHLHDGSFAHCALIDRGPWGWRVELSAHGAASQVIEMRAERFAGHYRSTTIAGSGKGTEIRVSLQPIEPDLVDVTVEFHLPEERADRLATLGQAYVAIYSRLWDEDEVMMQAREHALKRKLRNLAAASLDLGTEQAVRAALPMTFEFGNVSFRMIDLDGVLRAHSTVCPHWLGPLDQEPVCNGVIRCPWHGYRFDVADGTCREHPALRLSEPPNVRIIDGQVVVQWAG